MIMGEVFTDQVVQMTLTKNKETTHRISQGFTPIQRRRTPDFRGHFVRAVGQNSQETL